MVGRRFISGRQALGVEFDMRNAMYAHLLRLSFGFYDRHQTGQLMSRATVDLQAVRFFLGYGLIFFFQHVLTIVGVTAIMLWTDWRLALVALAITPFVVVLAYRYSKVSHPVLRDVQQKMADVATVAEENIVGVHVVKSFAQEEQEQAKFQQRSNAVFEQTVLANRQRALYVPLLSFVPLLAQAAILLVGGWMVTHGSLTVGQFFAFNLYVTMLIMPLRMLGMWIGQSQRATASGERIFQVLDEPEEVADRPGAEPAARPRADPVRGRLLRLRPERPVLHGVDLAIEPDQNVAVIGHTGSGKTTLTALVPRFYDVTEGRVLIDGVDVRDVSRCHRFARRSRSSRRTRSSSRRRCARTSPSARPTRRTRRSSQPRASRRRTTSSSSCRTATTRSSASGESRSPAASASASRSRARCDEPAHPRPRRCYTAVDATTEARIRLGLREAMKGRTTLIIAHRLSTISLADEVVVLDHGARGRAGDAGRAGRIEPRLPGDLRARPRRPRAGRPAGGDRVKVWQPGSHLTMQRGAEVEDWSGGARRTASRPSRVSPLATSCGRRSRSSRSSRRATSSRPPYLAKLALDDGIRADDYSAAR